jgi:hypothetical protein
MAYGKFRDGITSLGRQAADWAQDGQSNTYTTKRRGDVLVRKSGDFTNIFQDKQGTDGFYSLGETTGNGTRIVGSVNGFTFGDRGPAPTAGGFDVSQVSYYGKGLGSIVVATATGAYTDFDGKTCQAFDSKLQRTRNGRTLVDYYNTSLFIPFETSNTFPSYARGSYWFNGSQHVFFAGAFLPVMIAGQHLQAFLRDDGNGNQDFGNTSYVPNQLGWYATPVILAPGTMMKMDRYLRPHYTPTSVNAAACPGLTFSYTLDAGETWQDVSSADLWQAEMNTVVALPITTVGATLFNEAISYANIVAAPLTRRFSVCLAAVPYLVASPVPGDPPTLRVKVKLGLIDAAAGCSMLETVVLFDGAPDDAAFYMGRGVVAIPGGVLIFTRDVVSGPNAGADSWKYPARIRMTPNGSDLFDWATMPLQESYTGAVSGYNTKLMVCPMWDGKHSLYRSLDYGKTWARAGTISDKGVPPIDAPAVGQEQYVLHDFTVITFLRKDDKAANASPLTPWLSDSRYPNPPSI